MNLTVANRRLLKLAAFLQTVPRKRFHYERWFTLYGVITGGLKPACGTSACALGWACSIPAFRKAGLRSTKTGRIHFKGVTPGPWQNDSALDAATKLFGLTFAEADYLFIPSGDEQATPKQVAKKIRRFVAERS